MAQNWRGAAAPNFSTRWGLSGASPDKISENSVENFWRYRRFSDVMVCHFGSENNICLETVGNQVFKQFANKKNEKA